MGGEDAGELEISGSIGEIKKEPDAVAEETDSPTKVEISFREDLGADTDVANDLVLGGIMEGAVIEVDLFGDGVGFVVGGAEGVEGDAKVVWSAKDGE